MTKSRVLVIGGTRNVGYQLTWRLLAAGHKVTLLNRGTMADPFENHIERIKMDRSSSEFARLLAVMSYDVVVDFAAYGAKDVESLVSHSGQDAIGHYIFVSSGQVYLVRDDCPMPSKESDYVGRVMAKPAIVADVPDWQYGVDKRAAEDVLDAAWQKNRFAATKLRIPVVNSERDHYRRLENYFWRIIDGYPVLLPDGGRKVLRQVYSGSVVDAIVLLMGNAATFGQAYNLTQDETPTLAELLTLLAEEMGATPEFVDISSEQLLTAGLSPQQVSPFSGRWTSFLDGTKAQQELGFQHEKLRPYLGKIVSSLLNHPLESIPELYQHRQLEIQLLHRIGK